MNINFRVTMKPNLFVKAGAGVSVMDQISLSYRVSLEPRNEIELATKENFEDLIGHVTIHAEIERSEKKSEGIGKMLYLPSIDNDNALYFVDVLVPKPLFDEILATARAGYAPSGFSIYVSGMDFGCAPDGSEIKWDNKTFPELKIDSIFFTIPLSLPTTSDAT